MCVCIAGMVFLLFKCSPRKRVWGVDLDRNSSEALHMHSSCHDDMCLTASVGHVAPVAEHFKQPTTHVTRKPPRRPRPKPRPANFQPLWRAKPDNSAKQDDTPAMLSRAVHRSLASIRLPARRVVAQRRWMTPAPREGERLMERRADRELPSTLPPQPSQSDSLPLPRRHP